MEWEDSRAAIIEDWVVESMTVSRVNKKGKKMKWREK